LLAYRLVSARDRQGTRGFIENVIQHGANMQAT
jgi:hypothetical protein